MKLNWAKTNTVCIFLGTQPSLLKCTNPKLFFFCKNLPKITRLIFVYWKVRDLHPLYHLMLLRWFKFLVDGFNVLKFHEILLQCAICSLYRKKIIKKSYLPTCSNFFEHVTLNTHIFLALEIKHFPHLINVN